MSFWDGFFWGACIGPAVIWLGLEAAGAVHHFGVMACLY